MAETLQDMIQNACWVGEAIFNRNKTSGSSANMSFRCEPAVEGVLEILQKRVFL